jgi:sulfite reductase beta subunit-like hemoprotein
VVGVHPQRQPGLVAVGAVARLGRLDATTLAGVAALTQRPLRLSPARGVVVTDVPEAHATATVAQLEDLGLVTDPGHPATAVVACVGRRGCAAGFVDTLTDAGALIDVLADIAPEHRPASVHVSGCEKGCAHPGRTEWTLVGGPEPETYTARHDDCDVGHHLGATAAIALVTSRTVAQ